MATRRPGPTKQFPSGKLDQSDDGGLHFTLTQHDSKARLEFGTAVKWVELTATDAARLATDLYRIAKAIHEAEHEAQAKTP